MRSLYQSGHLFKGFQLLCFLFGRSFSRNEFVEYDSLSQLSELEKKSVLVALPRVVLSDHIIKAFDLLLAGVVPLLESLHCLEDRVCSDLKPRHKLYVQLTSLLLGLLGQGLQNFTQVQADS